MSDAAGFGCAAGDLGSANAGAVVTELLRRHGCVRSAASRNCCAYASNAATGAYICCERARVLGLRSVLHAATAKVARKSSASASHTTKLLASRARLLIPDTPPRAFLCTKILARSAYLRAVTHGAGMGCRVQALLHVGDVRSVPPVRTRVWAKGRSRHHHHTARTSQTSHARTGQRDVSILWLTLASRTRDVLAGGGTSTTVPQNLQAMRCGLPAARRSGRLVVP